MENDKRQLLHGKQILRQFSECLSLVNNLYADTRLQSLTDYKMENTAEGPYFRGFSNCGFKVPVDTYCRQPAVRDSLKKKYFPFFEAMFDGI